MPPFTYASHNDDWTRLLAERVKATEVAHMMSVQRQDERLGALAHRTNQIDARLSDGRRRMDELDDRLRTTTRELGPLLPLPEIVEDMERRLSPLPSRLEAQEEKMEAWLKNFVRLRDGLLYGMGMLLLSMLLSGKMTLDQFGKAIAALLKALP